MAEEAKLFHTMSITKAAIGTMYHIHEKQYPRNKELAFTTIGNALNMRVGKDWKEFEFNDFRDMVEADKNLREYSLSKLQSLPDLEEDEMVYSDYAYQMLASNMPDVADKFGKFIGDEPEQKLYKEIDKYPNDKGEMEEHIIWFRKGKGWKWEHTKSGEPLGPHGLHMTKDTAERFGELAKPHVLDMSTKERTPCENWMGIGKDEFTHYWNGWFFTKCCAFAVGYVVQVIAIVPNGAVSQLYEEDWGPEGRGLEKYPNHPRWSFIKNIEQFQSKFEQKTNEYLDKLKQPPLGQRGASIIMPSGSGKSFYIQHQNHKDEFIDCDPLTWYTNAQPHGSNSCPWNWDDHLKIICLQVDQVVALAKKRRFWIMGATWWSPFQINAIVILDETIHRKRLEMKEDKFEPDFYDKTIKGMLIPQLLKDSKQKKPNTPIFTTILECVTFIRANYSTTTVVYGINGERKSDQPQIKF